MTAIGIRNLAFYKKVLSYPNTMLLDPKYELASNIRKFDAAVVLTSTVGFEAIQAGVPVLLLGHTFYSDYPGITKIDSFAELEDCLRSLKKNRNEKNEEAVMNHYLPMCFPGRFNYMNDDVVDEENVDKLLVPIRQVLDSIKP
jgi:capsule polysaccharide export protein KpsC/LpsZ